MDVPLSWLEEAPVAFTFTLTLSTRRQERRRGLPARVIPSSVESAPIKQDLTVRFDPAQRVRGTHLATQPDRAGSRARGDAGPDSDADVAVLLEDGDWRFWAEKMLLAGLAYDVLLKHDLYIQPWPLARSGWESPATHPKQRFIETIRRDARPLTRAA